MLEADPETKTRTDKSRIWQLANLLTPPLSYASVRRALRLAD